MPAKKGAGRRARRTVLGGEIVAGFKEGLALVSVPPQVDVRRVRVRLGLSQCEFAGRFGFSFRTLQEWEQGRMQPDGAARAYLTVIDRDPQAVEAALGRYTVRAGA